METLASLHKTHFDALVPAEQTIQIVGLMQLILRIQPVQVVAALAVICIYRSHISRGELENQGCVDQAF